VTLAVRVANADRMITYAKALDRGIEVVFADGCRGVVPFADLPDVGGATNLAAMELQNPYEVILRMRDGETVELPWDVARHYCDPSYRPRIESVNARGRHALGRRIRRRRTAAGLTQAALAAAAGISRVTLLRIENGEQSPRYETLVALAQALGQDSADLLRPE
jgi:DNA-binding XRE family transcriptional regulator